jgi:hypothetical protein
MILTKDHCDKNSGSNILTMTIKRARYGLLEKQILHSDPPKWQPKSSASKVVKKAPAEVINSIIIDS